LQRGATPRRKLPNLAWLPGIIRLPSGGLFLQWKEGAVGKHSLYGRVFDKNLDAGGEAFTCPPGEPALTTA
jgi:hypothetical protein